MSRQEHIENLKNRRGYLAHDLFSLDAVARAFGRDVRGGAQETSKRVRDDLQETGQTLTHDSATIARKALDDTQRTARSKSRQAAQNLGEAVDPRPYAKEYPVASVAVASGIGLASAWLLLRARDRRMQQKYYAPYY